ncbi:hypothetical protein CKQ80_02010 [Pseudomonas moraviensis]|uniref:Uncharacterized protein n=1 Tax=Pseudomonas moraviensis TaxID=321662 RepID=A0A2A2PFG5_9PSED|nr:hypothetical protein [Pseudomonas moraviensis]PAW49598.1 hypothetical protein CKQ68_19835 [Pseudomonas moraviensis]PAW54103.1 hypothetical protein CKQ80_02010 [Pseudomonas moraviensis]
MPVTSKSILSGLFKYRDWVGVGLLLAALLNGYFQFNGSWGRFFTVLAIQLWFAQGVYNYLRGATIAIAPGGLGRGADPAGRAVLASFAFFLYAIFFFADYKY